MSLTVMGVSIYLVLYAGHSMLPGPLTARLVPAPPESVEVHQAPATAPAPAPAAAVQPSPVPAPAALLIPAAAPAPAPAMAAPVQVAEVQAPAKNGDEKKSQQTDKPTGLKVSDYGSTASEKAILGFGRAPALGHGDDIGGSHGKGNGHAKAKKHGRED